MKAQQNITKENNASHFHPLTDARAFTHAHRHARPPLTLTGDFARSQRRDLATAADD